MENVEKGRGVRNGTAAIPQMRLRVEPDCSRVPADAGANPGPRARASLKSI